MGFALVTIVLLLALQPTIYIEAYSQSFTDYFSGAAVSMPKLQNMNNCLTDIRSPLRMITTSLYNNHDVDLPFLVFLEIRDKSGITLYLAYHTGVLSVDGITQVASSWQLPQESGEYELRAFAISNFTKPAVLTEIKSVAVEANLYDCS